MYTRVTRRCLLFTGEYTSEFRLIRAPFYVGFPVPPAYWYRILSLPDVVSVAIDANAVCEFNLFLHVIT